MGRIVSFFVIDDLRLIESICSVILDLCAFSKFIYELIMSFSPNAITLRLIRDLSSMFLCVSYQRCHLFSGFCIVLHFFFFAFYVQFFR